jgi:hypothetical protein
MFPSTNQGAPNTGDISTQQAGLYSPAVTATVSGEPEPEPNDNDVLLEEAHGRFRKCVTAESAWRTRADEEISFCDLLDHWDQQMKDERKGRPCLTFDRVSPSVDQVVNDARQNPPEPRISPVGAGADKKTAEIIQGLIRNIEHDSGADIAYMTGYEHAVKIGRGWWRVLFVYENEDVFGEGIDPQKFSEQKIIIKRVPNWASVYPDPSSEEFDYSDMNYCFVTDDVDRTVFEKENPGKQSTASSDFSSTGDKVKDGWFTRGSVRVAEYWWVETSVEEMALLASGTVVPVGEVQPGQNIIARRNMKHRRVRWAKITGAEVLERGEWPGKWIPIIPALGRETVKDNKRILRGMIRPAMDSNLAFDFQVSKLAEGIGLSPISQFMVAVGQLEGFEHKWADANRKAYPFLEYRVKDAEGTPLQPPQRISPQIDVAGITASISVFDNNTKAALSTYDASLGQRGPQESGKAILARQNEGDNAHFHFHDNLARSMRHTGRVIVDLIPHVYTEERMIAVYDPDGSVRQVQINAPFKEGDTERIHRLGKQHGIARYDVTIGSGPSYASRRQQGAAALMELTRTMPNAMMRAIDLVIKSLDIPEGDQLADRLRPPDVQADKDGEPPVSPRVQQQLTQQTQMIQAFQQELGRLTQMLENKTPELASRERIAEIDAQTRLTIEAMKTGSQEAQTLLREELASLRDRLDRLDRQQELQAA